MKRLLIFCLCSVLLLSGCKGTILGTDQLETANYINKAGDTIFPSVNETTVVIHTCKDFVENIKSGNFNAAYAQLLVSDNTFVPLDAFKQYTSSWVVDDMSFTESVSSGVKTVTGRAGDFSVLFELTQMEDNSWKISLPSFTLKDFRIKVPNKMGITLDEKDISAYKTDDNVYTIPELAVTAHELTLTTAFGDPIKMSISEPTQEIDVTDYLSVKEPLRAQMFKLAGTTLSALNKTVLERDWEKFAKYFAEGVQVSNFSTSFETGYQAKKDIYDFKLAETRDLELSPLDVRFTGYDTIEVTLGTRWTWAGKDDYKVDNKTGEVTVRRTSEMKMKSVVELQYDGTSWYVISVDSESLARLTAGLEQWR